jgi:hypothetical protein
MGRDLFADFTAAREAAHESRKWLGDLYVFKEILVPQQAEKLAYCERNVDEKSSKKS